MWCIPIPTSDCLSAAPQQLQSEEYAKAKRFRNKEQGQWWAYTRLAMRNILGSYIDTTRDHVTFSLAAKGKPKLHDQHQTPLYFNLSHCADVALLAVTKVAEIGVDVENIKHIPDIDIVAKNFFSRQEQASLLRLDGVSKLARFYEIWTQKEAVIKANGAGLSIPLSEVDIISENSRQWTDILSTATKIAGKKYLLKQLHLAELGYASTHKAAICIENAGQKNGPQLSVFSYVHDHY